MKPLYASRLPRLLGVAALFALAVTLTACDENDLVAEEVQADNLLEAVANSPDGSSFEALVRAVNLAGELESGGPYTIFVPLDPAFNLVETGQDEDDPGDALFSSDAAGDVARYHVVSGIVPPERLYEVDQLESLTGTPLSINTNGLEVTVNGARLATRAETGQPRGVEVGNGIVYAVDRVLFPEAAQLVTYRSDLSALQAALAAAGLLDDVAGLQQATIFAPADAAFGALGTLGGEEDNLDELVENEALLAEVLGYHVVPGRRLEARDFEDVMTLETLSGETLNVEATRTVVEVEELNDERTFVTVTVNGVDVGEANLETPGVVFHLLPSVLLEALSVPERLSILPDADEVVALLDLPGASGIKSELETGGPWTFFAPADRFIGALDAVAFEEEPALLQEVLRNLIVPGEVVIGAVTDTTVVTLGGAELRIVAEGEGDDRVVTVNGIPVAEGDLLSENGRIQVLDGVPLLGELNIAQRVLLAGQTTALEVALEEAELLDALRGDGPFTVFAPVDDAARVDSLVTLIEQGEMEVLREILQYHVVAGQEIAAADIMDGMEVQTLAGGRLLFDVDGDTVTVRSAGGASSGRVIAADVPAENGIIHLIDGVLLPPEED